MKNYIAGLFLFLFFGPAYANSPIIIEERLQWETTPVIRNVGEVRYERWSFHGAVISDEAPDIPYLLRRFPVERDGRLRVEVLSAHFEPFDRGPSANDDRLATELLFETSVERQGSRFLGKVAFAPIIRRGSRFERLVEISLRVTHEPAATARRRSPDHTRTSVLSDGAIFKVAVVQTGIHKLTYGFLKDELGVDIDNVDPRRIQLYGNGGGMLPEYLGAERVDDLAQNPIFIEGESDGSFDSGDYILFYGEGPDRWYYDAGSGQFLMHKNIYDVQNYYFLRIGNEDGLRVEPQSSLGATAYTTQTFDDYARMEEDRVNLLHEWNLSQGSDQRWYGDHFRNARERTYDDLFELPNLAAGEPVRIRTEMALRALQPSRFTLEVNGRNYSSTQARRVWSLSGPSANEQNYADTAVVDLFVVLDRPDIDLTLRYPFPGGSGDGSEGWLDYIQVNARRELTFTGPQMRFRDTRTLDYPDATFELAGATDQTLIWDITDPLRPKVQEGSLSNGRFRFGLPTATLRQFVAFNPGGALPSAIAVGELDNQNIHGLDEVDMVIVYHPDFAAQAEILAAHRRDFSGYAVELVRIDQLYNEFSSGRQDPTAIRDFAHMLHERSDRFRYLLLFGDGSFDNRNIYGLGNNFIPVYETRSFNPIFAFPTDDYFAVLEGNTPADPLRGTLSIATGRLPVKTPEEAQAVVDKIIHYDTKPETLGGWRNRLVFVADDEDSMTHTRQADQIADTLLNRRGYFNVDKLYLDAYPQVANSGGDRVPGLTEALNRAIFQGALVVTYLGHGGAEGWAQERILNIPDIQNWENFDQQTLLITATCSFAGYDNPAFVSAGEEALLNRRGGAIGLFTTVRAVFSSYNRELTETALEVLFDRPDGQTQTLGEVMQRSKNRFTFSGQVTNARKFSLLGDPAMKPALPEYSVRTTRVNSRPVDSNRVDTLRALQRVTVEGEIIDPNGQLFSDFDGILFPTIFDKKLSLQTLGQDQGSFAFPYQLQKNIVFKGRASVQDGRFRFTFVIPKDINFEFGRGKISYYAAAEQNLQDASGAYEEVLIGDIDPDGLSDQQGPLVDVYMNTEDFAFGGITDPDPTLLVTLEDDNGINIVGNSIGHDLEAVLDEDTQNTLLLNDFYESELDDYRRGRVRFPLSKLEEGRHTIRVKAWDVANNSSEGYTEFVVAASEEIALEHVLNYPNPFTDRTCFQFDHNLANQELEVQIQIFTISGRLVKTLEQVLFSDGAIRRDDCISWTDWTITATAWPAASICTGSKCVRPIREIPS